MTVFDWFVVVPAIAINVAWWGFDAFERKIPAHLKVAAGSYLIFATLWLDMTWWVVAIPAVITISVIAIELRSRQSTDEA